MGIRIIQVLEPLAHAITLLSSDKNPTLSIVLPVATALVRKHLLISDDDPKLVFDLKGAIAAKLNSRLCDI